MLVDSSPLCQKLPPLQAQWETHIPKLLINLLPRFPLRLNQISSNVDNTDYAYCCESEVHLCGAEGCQQFWVYQTECEDAHPEQNCWVGYIVHEFSREQEAAGSET